MKICLLLWALLSTAAPAATGRPLEVAFSRDTDFVDRLHTDSAESATLSQAIFDTLLYRDPHTGELQGLLAQSWRWNADRTVIEFELRRGVRFHDGETFDADDVIHTLEFAMNARSRIRQREASFGFLRSAEKIGPYSVRVSLKQPSAKAEDVFASRLVILPDRYTTRHGGSMIHRTAPIGTGPFKVSRLVAGSEILLSVNNQYFRGPKPAARSPSMRIRFMPDAQTQLAELLSGSLDFAWDLPVNQAMYLGKDSRFMLGHAAGARLLFLSLDVAGRSGRSPVQDPRVRRAMMLAIDRSMIATALGGRGAKPASYQCLEVQIDCPSAVTAPLASAAEARRMLADAGYPDGFTLDLQLGSPRLRSVAEALQWQLGEAGIDVRIRQFTLPAWRRRFLAGASQSSLVAYGGDLLHVAHTLPIFFDLGPNDYVRDPKVDELLRDAERANDSADSRRLHAAALERIRLNGYTIPLHGVVVNFVHRRELCHSPGEVPLPNLMSLGPCKSRGS
jgi:peptide/nickel transport system substrate-binding protein